MAVLKLRLDLKNEAFQNGNKRAEAARILKETAEKLENGFTNGLLRDINGNTVGEFSIT